MIYINVKNSLPMMWEKVIQDKFPDGTLNLKFNNTSVLNCITDKNFVYIMWLYDSDSEIFTLKCLTDIFRRIKNDINLILYLPYVPHARMDRIYDNTENFSLKSFAEMINNMNFGEVHTNNVHSNVSLALFNNIHDHMFSEDICKAISHFKADILFFPDEGAMKRYKKLNIDKPYGFGIKQRDWKTGKITDYKVITDSDIKGKRVLIVDDICSYGGTFIVAAKALKEDLMAEAVALYVTHCEDNIFKGDVLTTNYIDHVYTTNSIIRNYSHDKISFVFAYPNKFINDNSNINVIEIPYEEKYKNSL